MHKNEHSRYLIALARQVANAYAEIPSLRAAMVTGSSVKGLSDNYSDIDMTIYYADALPSEEALAAIRAGLGVPERKWMMGDRAEGAFMEAFALRGVEVQIGHSLIATWEAEIESGLTAPDLNSPIQKAFEGTLNCIALIGAPWIEKWQARLADYPPALGEAMLRKHLSFFPLWGLVNQIQTRDCTIWYHQMMVEAAQNLIASLAGLNRLYFTSFQFKHMQYFVDQMTVCPPDLGARVERLFGPDRAAACAELESLVAQTVALVEQHMPAVDTSGAKRRLGWRQLPWDLPVS